VKRPPDEDFEVTAVDKETIKEAMIGRHEAEREVRGRELLYPRRGYPLGGQLESSNMTTKAA